MLGRSAAARLEVCLVFSRVGKIAAQSWIGKSIGSSTKTGVTAVIEATIGQVEVPNKGPDVGVMPIDDGMDAHKVWPAVIGGIKMSQPFAMRVRPPGTDKDSLDVWISGEVMFEARTDGHIGRMSGVFGDGETVCTR